MQKSNNSLLQQQLTSHLQTLLLEGLHSGNYSLLTKDDFNNIQKRGLARLKINANNK